MSTLRARAEAALNRLWYRPSEAAEYGLIARSYLLLATPLEWLFRTVVAVRGHAYDRGWLTRQRVPSPVVVVGNLSVGGTGKTPFTIYLAQCLQEEARLRVGIVTRGYGGRAVGRGRAVRVDGDSDASEVGDEAVLLARRTGAPVLACRDRALAARELAGEVDLLLADDGLQHLRLARDMEIALVDQARGLGNGRLLPRGPLREPPSRLASCDLIVLTGSGTETAQDGNGVEPGPAVLPERVREPMVARYQADAAYALTDARRRRPLAAFAQTPVHAVAGIAQPQRFFGLLRRAGLTLVEHPFEDHAALDARSIRFTDGLPVLMTEKDAVKCRSFADDRCWAVPLEMHLTPADRASLVAAVVAHCAQGAPNNGS